MEMTLEQYIVNPQLKSNAILTPTAREAIKAKYKEKYDAVMVRERGFMNYETFYDEKRNRIFVHLKVPSETVEKFYYDVVFEFYANENIANVENVSRYFVKFYSNDPSFVFTYAHAFLDNGILIEELKSKMSKKAIKEDAKSKNPYNQVGYVKTIYFAYLYMSSKGLLSKHTLTAGAKKFSVSALVANIHPADEVVENRIAAGEKLNKVKKAQKKKEERQVQSTSNNQGTAISKTKTTSVIKASKSSKGTNFIKTTKAVNKK